MRRRGPAAGKPEHTYVGRPQLCHQHAQLGPGGLKAPTYLRRSLKSPNIPTQDTLSSAISMRSRGPADALSSAISRRRRGLAAGKPEHTYEGRPQLCHQYAQTGPGCWKARMYLRRTPSALPSVCADGARRRLESPNLLHTTLLALPSACADKARRFESPNLLPTTLLTLPSVCVDGAHRVAISPWF